jgi:hypothetical protein
VSEEENESAVIIVTFLGIAIVVPVHLVHPLRQVYEFPNKLVHATRPMSNNIGRNTNEQKWCKRDTSLSMHGWEKEKRTLTSLASEKTRQP